MKIAINFKTLEIPYGGGNNFCKNLIDYLLKNKIQITKSLKDKNIDIILILDPRRNHPQSTFSILNIWFYQKFINPKVVVIHRINECDERKKTKNINSMLKNANFFSDHTVLVGSWLKKLDIIHNPKNYNISTILNGANSKIFLDPRSDTIIKNIKKFKIVTHHWSNNEMKGFDIYRKIDIMLKDPKWNSLIEFTYIGNIPPGFKFQNSHYISPLNNEMLAKELSKHHIYVTASINEPGSNHQNEGAMCGLPLLYRESGCLPEYCAGFGESFNLSSFEGKLKLIINNYKKYKLIVKNYPHNSNKTNSEYIKLFTKLIQSREELIKNREYLKLNFNVFIKLLKSLF